MPEPGSLQEALCISVFSVREEYALLEVLLNNSEGKSKSDVFNDYKSVRFPFIEGGKVQESKDMQEVMQRAFEKGVYEIDRGSAPSKPIRSTE
tara:strand:+ start:75 stop:353 length:279 start_codon:yes stop_codon:yes gene_type:complete